ncbi:MAG: FecR domain-containing protein [Pedobacter sp.]|uniref:FecR family protein n=1 Tax=Pedobacter sp. TaxID=1411316 RepID=UPI002807882D|nr:FecR domain-containing protein [Pedobacter sp.]MDQ8004637.1 FecR domain-containing protein [Pedobacter sp.]
MADNPEILSLISRYLNNPEDLDCKAQIEKYRNQSKENNNFFMEMERLWVLSAKSAVLERIDEKSTIAHFESRLLAKSSPIKMLQFRRTIIRWAAASIVLLGVASITYFFASKGQVGSLNKPYASDANPGGNKAVLVLADGRKISLTDVNNGAIAKEAGLSITKTSDGQLIYTVSEVAIGKAGKSLNNAFNTIETPKGGMWQVKLPDGSLVWLNAASSLTYPLAFSEGQKRIVELKGEAYFEVAKDELHPFVVKTVKQEVEVLGTQFNINAYSDESTVKTTLLEGSVKVSTWRKDPGTSEFLKPGQQSILLADAFNVKEVDVDEAIAWKNGYFMFNNEKQESIMRKIARWYNVQIVYANADAREVTYYGSISRFENVSRVLRKFEQTGEVRFEVDKNKITVYKEDNN